MARLTIVIDVPPTRDNTDPAAQIDPHDIAGDVVATWNEWAERNGGQVYDFETAAWGMPS